MGIHTVETIKERLKEVNVTDLFFTKKEVKELPSILRDSEVIMYATSGYVETSTMLIVCTNERVIFLDKGLIFGLKMHDIPLNKINSVSISKGLILGKFIIHHGSAALKVDNVEKSTLPIMVDTINEQRQQLNQGPASVEQKVEAPTNNAVQQLKDLKELLDLEIITIEEFESKKAELLKAI